GGRTVMAAASTHAGEETMLIEAHRRLRASFPRLLTVVAPRHPERGPDILAIAHAAGLKAALRSRGELPGAGTDVYVADTLGELGSFWSAARSRVMAGRIRSSRSSWARRFCTARTFGTSRKSTPRSTSRMARKRGAARMGSRCGRAPGSRTRAPARRGSRPRARPGARPAARSRARSPALDPLPTRIR